MTQRANVRDLTARRLRYWCRFRYCQKSYNRRSLLRFHIKISHSYSPPSCEQSVRRNLPFLDQGDLKVYSTSRIFKKPYVRKIICYVQSKRKSSPDSKTKINNNSTQLPEQGFPMIAKTPKNNEEIKDSNIKQDDQTGFSTPSIQESVLSIRKPTVPRKKLISMAPSIYEDIEFLELELNPTKHKSEKKTSPSEELSSDSENQKLNTSKLIDVQQQQPVSPKEVKSPMNHLVLQTSETPQEPQGSAVAKIFQSIMKSIVCSTIGFSRLEFLSFSQRAPLDLANDTDALGMTQASLYLLPGEFQEDTTLSSQKGDSDNDSDQETDLRKEKDLFIGKQVL